MDESWRVDQLAREEKERKLEKFAIKEFQRKERSSYGSSEREVDPRLRWAKQRRIASLIWHSHWQLKENSNQNFQQCKFWILLCLKQMPLDEV